MARRRRNPMFRGKDLTPLLLVGGGLLAGASGLFGANIKASLSQVGSDIKGTFGGKSATVSTSGVSVGSSAAVGSGNVNGIGGTGVYTGTAGSITAAAHANGVTSASQGLSAIYGAALWSLRSGQPQSAFTTTVPANQQPTWASVAVTGQ